MIPISSGADFSVVSRPLATAASTGTSVTLGDGYCASICSAYYSLLRDLMNALTKGSDTGTSSTASTI